MRILLIGARGQLGSDLLRNNTRHEMYAPDRADLELANTAQTTRCVREFRPDVVINCAAFHNVPLCEDHPEQAFMVNCIAVRNLAVVIRELGGCLVTFSSDYVFGGDEKREPYAEYDRPAPLQMYGITRAAGEQAALFVAPHQALVIRTCGLYGRSGSRAKGGNFVTSRLADAAAGRHIEMAAEQVVTPTSTDDLSQAVLTLIDHPQRSPGIYHLVNEGQCSWYEFTRAIIEIKKLDAEVIPVDRRGRSGSMRRPLYSVLANTRARALGISLRPWREALQAYLLGPP